MSMLNLAMTLIFLSYIFPREATNWKHKKNYRHKTSQGKMYVSKVQRKPGASFQESSPSGVTQDILMSSSRVVTTHAKCCLSGKLIRNLVPRAFIESWSYRHSLLSTYQNSRLPEGKQVFNINHIVFTNSLGPVSASYLSVRAPWERSSYPSSQGTWPVQGQTCRLASHGMMVRPTLGTPFYTWYATIYIQPFQLIGSWVLKK